MCSVDVQLENALASFALVKLCLALLCRNVEFSSTNLVVETSGNCHLLMKSTCSSNMCNFEGRSCLEISP